MSMTREDARIELKAMKDTFEEYEPGGSRGQMALKVALSALRPVSREQVEKVPRCEHCKDGKSFDGQVVIMGNKGMFPLNFCPLCGAPMTDEAVQMVMERLEALKDGKDDND